MDRNVYEACSDLVTEYQTHTVSADEILASKINYLVPIPFKSREDLAADAAVDRLNGLFQGEIMPQLDLRVLHYFATQLCLQRYPQLIDCFDETSLITLGLLVEKWVEDYLISNENIRGLSSSDEDEDEDEYEDDTDSEIEDDSDQTLEKDDENKEERPHNQERDDKAKIRAGPAQMISKMLNYRDYPADI
ncbi:Rrn10p KNAG_0G01520 [Huiozyma naganishii CBS 8797]|uniref:RNA polymerase I-specific transcription initiation factor RRN10 n=1 Tax=Huiozyma naganishii (strain ATCC MYA-139 / BCRC 22969 / CBS 8797 / KCTC 17520 / NBRC 10181 / NCYC 3082 / Yp74L-3) TaxID=1071383 RepID=J7R8L4_HUIN7|nr:hypothetical protein KNAG_0G01520 [Kazachstania naganishii CBS 8797]CCK71210.1 hypothetical protein KNAG_0G01520 [Kazachstania naganishii CBS 8797]